MTVCFSPKRIKVGIFYDLAKFDFGNLPRKYPWQVCFLEEGFLVMVCKIVVCVLFCFCLAGAYRPGRGGGLVAKSFFVVHLERLTVHLG